jgi:hypothetical protein
MEKMRRLFMVFILLIVLLALFIKFSGAETFTWSNPTTYVDGSAISAAKQAQIKTHIFYGSVSTGPFTEFAVANAGTTTYTGPLPVDVGISAYYTLKSELDGLQSAYLTPAIAYTRAPIACSSGSNLAIKP